METLKHADPRSSPAPPRGGGGGGPPRGGGGGGAPSHSEEGTQREDLEHIASENLHMQAAHS
jgi:hypothetical protein